MLRTIQVGLNTSDLSGTLRLYAEAFGFRNSGGQGLWGDTIGLQGLGPDSRALMWWMVGAQPFFELELFTHSVPAQRPQPDDWRPCDHGWVRFGVAVADFDAARESLARHGVQPINGVAGAAGQRRLAFRDPYVGCVVEVMEGARPAADCPAVVYATSSVSDLASARRFYGETLGLQTRDIAGLHGPEDEALWGLGGAQREGFLVAAGDVLLEVVRYSNPAGKPRSADYLISNQGIMNIAMGSRDKAEVAAALERMRTVGLEPPFIYDDGPIICGYILDPEREIEFCALPEEMDALTGFAPAADFLR